LIFAVLPQAITLKKGYRLAEERKMLAQDMQADS
jgi:hypothetical protein